MAKIQILESDVPMCLSLRRLLLDRPAYMVTASHGFSLADTKQRIRRMDSVFQHLGLHEVRFSKTERIRRGWEEGSNVNCTPVNVCVCVVVCVMSPAWLESSQHRRFQGECDRLRCRNTRECRQFLHVAPAAGQ